LRRKDVSLEVEVTMPSTYVKEEHITKAIVIISDYQKENLITPNRKVLADELNLTEGTVSQVLKILEERGFIVRGGGSYAIR